MVACCSTIMIYIKLCFSGSVRQAEGPVADFQQEPANFICSPLESEGQ
jgi:hypothetical protein